MTFGPAAGLGASQFTLELWFRRTGAGVGTSTGTGGIACAIPLITKGRAEAEGSNVDMNYFLGIDATSGKLVADFEEGAGAASPGLNHPVSGNTVVTQNVWHHAAATYDGTTWRLYLDGVQDGTSRSASRRGRTRSSTPPSAARSPRPARPRASSRARSTRCASGTGRGRRASSPAAGSTSSPAAPA